jgi:hypothetical protein
LTGPAPLVLAQRQRSLHLRHAESFTCLPAPLLEDRGQAQYSNKKL